MKQRAKLPAICAAALLTLSACANNSSSEPETTTATAATTTTTIEATTTEATTTEATATATITVQITEAAETTEKPPYRVYRELLLAAEQEDTLLSSDGRLRLHYQYERRGKYLVVTTKIANLTDEPVSLEGDIGFAYPEGAVLPAAEGIHTVTVPANGETEFAADNAAWEDGARMVLSYRFSQITDDAEYHYSPQQEIVVTLPQA